MGNQFGVDYPVLLDKEYLKKLYDSKLTGTQISKIIGCSDASVNLYLKKYGITNRTYFENSKLGHAVNDNLILNDYSLKVIAGCLLGDATFRKGKGNSGVSISKNNIGEDHINYVAKILFGDFWKSRIFTTNEKYILFP